MHWLLALAALSNTASAAGDGVLYYTGHSGFASSSYFPPSHLEDVIENEECGTFTETSTWPSDLSPYRMIVLMIPSNSWSASEITQLQDFIADDGVLVAVGDSSGYDSAHVTPMNNLMTSLGVTSSFQTAAIDSGCSGNQAPAATSHALTTDISSTGIQFGWSSDLTVSASATELFTGPSGQALAAVEGQVVLISDINVFIDDCSLNNDNRQFFKNMYHHGTSLDSCDMDGDGYDAGHCGGADCDDCDAASSTGGTYYLDADGDSYGSSTSMASCSLPSGYVTTTGDCNDTDSAIYPGASEYCNGIDDDCDGSTDEGVPVDASTWYADTDGDGFGSSAVSTMACSAPTGFGTDSSDCNDTDSSIFPGATETCNGIDDDCDGTTDESDAVDVSTWYADTDGDGFGDSASTTLACSQPTGFGSDATDCDDTDSAVNPGATETCNGIDDNCDGTVDEASAVDTLTWYADTDGDGFGDPASTTLACDQPSGFGSDATDCDDTDSAVNPAATEVCDAADVDEDCDGLSDDADTSTDTSGMTTWTVDGDGDGYGDDSATGTDYCDDPSDSSTTYVANASDCDDADSAVHPDATEVCDAADVDEDCDGLSDDADSDVDASTLSDWAPDTDGDGYGDDSSSLAACDDPSTSTTTYIADATDCDDSDSAVNPAATEACDAADVDEDCDGLADDADPDAVGTSTFYPDADDDGYGDLADSGTAFCDDPSTASDPWSTDNTDCLDTDPAVHPGATEVCNGLDDDCDAGTSEDGTVYWEPDSGSASALTSTFAAGSSSSLATWTETDDGTLNVCAGTWYVKLKADGANIDIYGPAGSASTILDGGDRDRVLEVKAGSVVDLDGFTLQKGDKDKGAAIKVEDSTLTGDDVVLYDNYADGAGGGALWVKTSTVTLTNCELDSNEALYDGGGIYLEDDAIVSLSTCDLVDNLAGDDGGGVFMDKDGTLSMSGVTLDANEATGDGGGIYLENDCVLTVSGSSFTDNVAGSTGGGIAGRNDTTVTVSGTTFDANVADYGGGLYTTDATTISGSTLSSNSATWYGGAWYAYLDDVDASITSSTLTSNSAGYYGDAISTDVWSTSHYVTGSSLSQSGHGSEPLHLRYVDTYSMTTSFTCGYWSCY